MFVCIDPEAPSLADYIGAEALGWLDKALGDRSIAPHIALANFYRAGGRVVEAEQTLRKALEIEPGPRERRTASRASGHVAGDGA